jgi:hypothetical protein
VLAIEFAAHINNSPGLYVKVFCPALHFALSGRWKSFTVAPELLFAMGSFSPTLDTLGPHHIV